MAEAGTGTSNSPPPNQRRRSSFAGQTFADLFGAGRNRLSTSTDSGSGSTAAPTSQYPGPITSAAAQARRMSLSTGGLSASANQSSTSSSYNANTFRRRDSISSSNSTSIDENAIEDDNRPLNESQPTTPFARRVSFGARALRDVKSGSSPAGSDKPNGRSASIAQTGLSSSSAPVSDGGKKTTPPNAKGRGEGYNWADSFRSRAERSASITSIGPPSPNPNVHGRTKSIASVAPPVAPPQPKYNTPDHFQERILKGDFYMD